MVDVYMRETAYNQETRSVTDKSNPVAISWLEKQSAGRTSQLSFSPAASPHTSLEVQTPHEFTVPVSPKRQVSPKIHVISVKPVEGTGCMISSSVKPSTDEV